MRRYTLKQKMELFYAPKLKIERAIRHIRDLYNEVITYTRKKPYKVVVEGDNHGHALVLRVHEDVPISLSTYIGDVIHNLRASLDLLACDLVRRAGQKTDDVYFPFSSSAEVFERTIVNRHIDRAGQDIVDLIRSVKPYTGGNHLLRAIHDLDIADKHIALIPVATFIGIKDLQVKNSFGPLLNIKDLRVGPIQDGLKLISMPATSNIQVGQQFNASFHISFGEGQPLSGEPVIEKLEELVQTVNGILSMFIHHCDSSKNPQ